MWSKVNKNKIIELTKQGLMHPAGLEIINIAKQNGSWIILDEVEDLIVSKDLDAAFKKNKTANTKYQTLSPSNKKMLLYKLVLAKTETTRQKRIEEIIAELITK